MTYFGFLLRFLLVPIALLLGITFWATKTNPPLRSFRNARSVWMGIGIHILLAVIYTTPWDNYLVATRVWYYNPRLVTGLVIGYVPIEEYTFFVLETILAGLWWWILARTITLDLGPVADKRPAYVSAGLLAPLWLVSTYLLFFGEARWTYLSIILFWAIPPIFIQLLFGADILWHYRRLVFWSILVPAGYLSLMDIVALKETTWSISTSQTTGILFFGILPLEEAIFFFATNLLITFGLTLFLARVSQERFAGIRQRVRVWREKQSLDPQSR